MSNKKISSKGQTTIELLIVLSISLVIMVIVYAMYAEQVQTNNETSDFFLAKSAVQKIVNASNTVYLSGIGSRTKIEVEFPSSVDLENSVISSNVILLKMFNGNDIIGVTDVNLEGVIRNQNGKQVIYLFFDGDNVKLQYLDFELNQYSISFSTIPGTSKSESILIRNNYFEEITFFLTQNFSHSNVSLGLSDYSITIPSGNIETIDLDFVISDYASGNYSGNIIVTGKVNDANISKTISIGVEVLLTTKELMIYPLETSFSTNTDSNIEKTFSICNKSLIDFSDLSWSVNGYPDGNIFEWVSNLEDLTNITQISSGYCEEATLTFSIPIVDFKDYNGSISVNYTDSKNNPASYSALISIEVLSDLFFFSSVILQNLEANYFLSNFVKKSDNNYWLTTGELDWNDLQRNDSINSMVDGEISFVGSELSESNYLFDESLVGLWHLNDNVLDSSVNNNHGSWGGTETYDSGLWGTNAGEFDGVNYIDLGSSNLDTDYITISLWAKFDSVSGQPSLIVRDGSPRVFAIYMISATQLRFWTMVNSSWVGAGYDVDFEPEIGKWYHIVGVKGATTQELYIDNVQKYSANFSGVINKGDTIASLGRNPAGSYSKFDGSIEEVTIWNRPLDEEEVSELYESQAGEFHEPSIVGLWHLNDDALDSSGLGNNGSWSGTESYEQGLFGTNAGTFDNSSRISLGNPDELNLNDDFTISVWFKNTLSDTTNMPIIEKATTGKYNYIFAVIRNNHGTYPNNLYFAMFDGVNQIEMVSGSNERNGEWHHGVISRDKGNELRLYVDGVLVDIEIDIISGSVITSQIAQIGDGGWFQTEFEGLIEEVAIWSRVLSEEEVKTLYEKQKGDWLDQNLVAYYKFNESSGTTIFDSARNYNGTLASTASINAQGLWDSNALSLNGTSDYVDIGNVSDLNFGLDSNFSISGWVWPNSSFPVWGTLFSKGNAIAAVSSYGIYCSSATSCNFRVRDASNLLECSFSPKASTWNHFVCNKWSGALDYCSCYLNGVVASSSSQTKINPVNSSSVYIGRGQAYYSGFIDEFKIYNRVLSDSEILADYNNFLNAKFVDNNILDVGKPREWGKIKINSDVNYSFGNELDSSNDLFDENLVGLWHLNDKNSSSWVLNSANGVRDGQLYNGADVNAIGLWDTNAGFFDGANDYISMDIVSSVSDRFTVSAWIYPTRLEPNQETYGNTIVATSSGYGVWLLHNAGKIRIYAFSSSIAAYYETTVAPVELNKWQMITVSAIRNGEGKVYFNGELIGSFVASDSVGWQGVLGIGDLRLNRLLTHKGNIEEVAIWSRVLSEEEVLDLFENSSKKIDLNLYSCSDALCENKTSSQQISNAKNNFDYDLTLSDSRYLGWSAFLKPVTGLESLVLERAVAKPFLQDVNISIIQ